MNLLSVVSLFRFQKSLIIPIQYAIQTNTYATPVGFGSVKKPKKSVAQGKVTLSVETDINKLLTYVCGSNIYKEGEDIKLKPDSEYPDWLWTIRTGDPPKIEEMDPNTRTYWKRLRKMWIQKRNLMKKMRKF